jgi:hypothetical protein
MPSRSSWLPDPLGAPQNHREFAPQLNQIGGDFPDPPGL